MDSNALNDLLEEDRRRSRLFTDWAKVFTEHVGPPLPLDAFLAGFAAALYERDHEDEGR